MTQPPDPASDLHLPQAELAIMLIIWQQEGVITSNQIMKALENEKSWGLTTVLNFLTRLVRRGFLQVEKNGRTNYYEALITQDQYLRQANTEFLQKLHGGSIIHLITSLYESRIITDNDLLKLRRYVDQREKEKGDIPHWLL